jgi:hypothetical protein
VYCKIKKPKVFFFLKEFIAIFAPIKGMRALDASHDASDNNKKDASDNNKK